MLSSLSDPRLLQTRAYSDGCWTETSSHFDVVDPATCLPIASVSAVDREQVDEAIRAAARAFMPWSALLPQQRAAILRRWFELIVAARDDLARIITQEQGKPLSEAYGEIDYAASFVEWFSEEARRINAESVTSHLVGAEMMVYRQPVGVVGLVTPWNFPSAMATRKAAAALAAGCTVVLHPSSETPLSALALAELAHRAGTPPCVFTVMTGDAPTIVEALCAHPSVKNLSFTGSTEIGRRIAAQCAPTMKRLVMELG